MPLPLLAIAALLAAAGTGAKAYTANKADKDAGRNLRFGLAEQAKKQKEGDSRVKENIAKLKQSNPDADRQSAQSQYVQALRSRRGSADAKPSILPGASKRFAQGVQQSASAGAGEDNRAASVASAIDAPLAQRETEGQNIASAASDLTRIADQAQSLDYLRKLKGSLIKPNATVNMLGDAAVAAGTSMAGSYAGASAPAYDTTIYSA